MEVQKTVDGQSFILTIEKRKFGIIEILLRTCSMIIGLLGLLISGLLCITIIGLIPGMGLGAASLLFVYFGAGKQTVTCPNCNKKQSVTQNIENMKCKKCEKLTLLEWK